MIAYTIAVGFSGPVFRIIDNIISDPNICFIILNDAVVETGVPGESGIGFPGVDGTYPFILIDDDT